MSVSRGHPGRRVGVRRAGSTASQRSGRANRRARPTVDVAELGGADSRVRRRCAVGAAKQPTVPSQGDTLKRPLSRNIIEADAAGVEEADEQLPALQHLVHRLGHRGMTQQLPSFDLHPVLEIGLLRHTLLLLRGKAFRRQLADDPALGVERHVDPLHLARSFPLLAFATLASWHIMIL